MGEIWVRGPAWRSGYWAGPRRPRPRSGPASPETGGPSCAPATSASFVDGELFVAGRLKDLIIVRGRNHYPQDIEPTAEHAVPAWPGCGAAFSVGAKEARW